MRTIGCQLPILALGTVLVVAGREVFADDAACQTGLDAVIKRATIPVHQKISIESAASPGKPLQSEMARKAVSEARQAMQKAEHDCTRRRSDALDDQSADLYSVEAKTASGRTDSQIWISTASGLPLRQHTVMVEQGSVKSQLDVRFDYVDVCAPRSISH